MRVTRSRFHILLYSYDDVIEPAKKRGWWKDFLFMRRRSTSARRCNLRSRRVMAAPGDTLTANGVAAARSLFEK
jgi:hypothetical protein